MYKINEIRELIRMIERSSISEVVIKTGKNQELIIKKQPHSSSLPPLSLPQQEMLTEQTYKKATKTQAEAEAAPSLEEKQSTEEKTVHHIVSPMVGTFYVSPTPDSSPYVKKGDVITADTIVCIVEAMKLFNEIEAEVEGEVVDIFVENGEFVEYGQPLFAIKRK
ncbi:acetyl-CoA carboxylase biotin carboxyl carrier protein [Bacillus taeanensis]|uniref:Biotin carboxyl carrier protein of acetyl-CoA carboxylase n=1 Tax=Bacillus taeanensis TaxID=273032 RepID=A0A366Y0I8_9BACI|nr:acetyl-CoA carboxylase biotin carboxyl carrier protein [Bacillus taeanensis]RBW70875.1 acetyl-CoA carboxylase biotin carboxyl carrier protein [Bacillus taeanensis]